jgi:excisionase family DNA binding protein
MLEGGRLTMERESPTAATESEEPEEKPLFPSPQSKTYATAEAARLLAISPSRVRQLVAQGKLPGERDRAGRLRIPKEALHAEQRRRHEHKTRGDPTKTRPARAAPVDAEKVADVLERTVRAATVLREELVEERARRHEAEKNLRAAEARIAAIEAAQADAATERAERIVTLERSLDDLRLALRALEPSEVTEGNGISDSPPQKPTPAPR